MRAAERKLGIGRDQIYTLRDKSSKGPNKVDEIVIIAEKLCAQLYDRDACPGEISDKSNLINVTTSAISKDDVEHALKRLISGNAAGVHGITVDLLKDGEHITLEKLAKLCTRCLRTRKVTVAQKNANIIQINNVAGIKELKICWRNSRYVQFISYLLESCKPNKCDLGFSSSSRTGRIYERYSAMEHTHAINQVIEKSAKYIKPFFLAIIDYERAFHPVEIAVVKKTLQAERVEEA